MLRHPCSRILRHGRLDAEHERNEREDLTELDRDAGPDTRTKAEIAESEVVKVYPPPFGILKVYAKCLDGGKVHANRRSTTCCREYSCS